MIGWERTATEAVAVEESEQIVAAKLPSVTRISCTDVSGTFATSVIGDVAAEAHYAVEIRAVVVVVAVVLAEGTYVVAEGVGGGVCGGHASSMDGVNSM